MSAPPDPLAALERAAFAEEYVSALRHDLRNKLASIRNSAFYLSRRTKKLALWAEDPNVPRLFAIIDESTEGADELLRGSSGLRAFVGRTARQVAARGPIELAIASARVPPGLGLKLLLADAVVACDPEELALALRCLVENAAEATGPQGVVRVEAGPAPAGFVVAVIDAGPGIDPARYGDVFLPMATTKPGHLGLGLNVARRIARRYGGDVAVVPAESGATVALTLPAPATRGPEGAGLAGAGPTSARPEGASGGPLAGPERVP